MQCMGMPQVYSVDSLVGAMMVLVSAPRLRGRRERLNDHLFLPIHARLLVNVCWTSIAASIQVEAPCAWYITSYVPPITIENVCHRKLAIYEPFSSSHCEIWSQINITWEWRKFMMSNTQYLFSHDVCDIYILKQKLWVTTSHTLPLESKEWETGTGMGATQFKAGDVDNH